MLQTKPRHGGRCPTRKRLDNDSGARRAIPPPAVYIGPAHQGVPSEVAGRPTITSPSPQPSRVRARRSLQKLQKLRKPNTEANSGRANDACSPNTATRLSPNEREG